MKLKNTSAIFSMTFALLMLVLAILACNFTEDEQNNTSVNTTTISQPQVAIVSPAANTTFPVRTEITVQARANDADGSGVTRIELFVGNAPESVARVDSTSPTGQAELTADLRWTPQTAGTYQLVVRAYRGIVSSPPQFVLITVQDSNITITPTGSTSVGTGGGFTPVPPPYDPTCRARVDVTTLNFRSSPDTNSDNIVAKFSSGDEPLIIGRLADNTWYQVQDRRTATRGWVYAEYTTRLGDCSNNLSGIPVISVQTTPSPQPTSASSATPTATATTAAAIDPADLMVRIVGVQNITLPQGGGPAVELYTLQIQNIGASNSGAFKAQLVLPGGEERIYDVASLAPGESTTVPQASGVSVTFSIAGTFPVYFKADYQNVVSERNEQNNEATLSVTVQAAP